MGSVFTQLRFSRSVDIALDRERAVTVFLPEPRLGKCRHFRRFDQNMSFSANWICRETNAAVGTPAEELML